MKIQNCFTNPVVTKTEAAIHLGLALGHAGIVMRHEARGEDVAPLISLAFQDGIDLKIERIQADDLDAVAIFTGPENEEPIAHIPTEDIPQWFEKEGPGFNEVFVSFIER